MSADNSTSSLVFKKCIPCSGGMTALSEPEYGELLRMLNKGWRIVDGFHLEKEFKFRNFRQALDFAIKVGELAESEGHHPDIYLAWGKAKISTWTHVIGGLSENDFILAAKIDLIDQPNS